MYDTVNICKGNWLSTLGTAPQETLRFLGQMKSFRRYHYRQRSGNCKQSPTCGLPQFSPIQVLGYRKISGITNSNELVVQRNQALGLGSL